MAGFEVSGLREFAVDLDRANMTTAPLLQATLRKAAGNIKDAMRQDLRAGRGYYAGIARDVDYDETVTDDGVVYEIGPKVGRGRAGNLANIAYFGGSRGGGQIRDPQEALDDEADALNANIDRIIRGVL